MVSLHHIHLADFKYSHNDTDVDHFGPTAATFNPNRWLEDDLTHPTEKPSQGLQHHSFGAGARACSGQFIATRLLYTALIRILSSYKIVASEAEPPNTDYVHYNQFLSALVAIPKDFKVRLVPREGSGVVDECVAEAARRTEGYYKEG